MLAQSIFNLRQSCHLKLLSRRCVNFDHLINLENMALHEFSFAVVGGAVGPDGVTDDAILAWKMNKKQDLKNIVLTQDCPF